MISGGIGANWAYHEPTNDPIDNSYFVGGDKERDSTKTSRAQARFDSMTEEQRARYYVHPTLWRRFKRFWNF